MFFGAMPLDASYGIWARILHVVDSFTTHKVRLVVHIRFRKMLDIETSFIRNLPLENFACPTWIYIGLFVVVTMAVMRYAYSY